MSAPPREDEGLVRAIGVRTLAANAINLTVGSGIFVLPAAVAAAMGAAGLLAYIVCGLAMGLVLLAYAEAGSRVGRSGGSYAYVEEAFGPYVGFLVGTLLWFAYGALSEAAIATALVGTLAAAYAPIGDPIPRTLLLIALFAGLALVNVRGVRQGARLAVGATIAKLAPLGLLIVAGLAAVRVDQLAWTRWPSAGSLGSTSLLLFFAFGGTESALTASGEIRETPRTVPRGILLGVAGVLVLYLGLHVVAQGVLGPDLATHKDAPLAAVAERVMGPWGRVLLLCGAALAMFGAIAGDLLATPRALFASARDGVLPTALGRVHPRFRTPYLAIAAYASLACAFAVTGAFQQLAILASASILLIYLVVCLATVALRRRDVRLAHPPFRLPGGALIPLLGCAIVLWLLAHTTGREALAIGVFLAAASALYFARRRSARGSPPSPRAA